MPTSQAEDAFIIAEETWQEEFEAEMRYKREDDEKVLTFEINDHLWIVPGKRVEKVLSLRRLMEELMIQAGKLSEH